MKLENIPIPRSSIEMQETFETYYISFYNQMTRMSNTKLNSFVQNFIDILLQLSKSPQSTSNVIRAAMGVVALHRFGYKDFNQLSLIFDRLLPQIDIEYVKFLSWCAGRLIHHPDIDQDRYVIHLFERLVGWARSTGKRARPLSAAYVLKALATNAGSSVVGYLPTLQSVMWLLVSHQSTHVLKATAEAITMFTRAIIRYRISDLHSYLDFLSTLCDKLLNTGSPIREYGALVLLDKLIKSYPDYFLKKMLYLYNTIQNAISDEPMLVIGTAFCTVCSLSLVDSKFFVDNIAFDLFENLSQVILEFPKEIIESIALLCKTIPDFLMEKIDELKNCAKELISEPDSSFSLLTVILNTFDEKCLPIDNKIINQLIKVPYITQHYSNFFISLANKNAITSSTSRQLCNRLIQELQKNKNSNTSSLIEPLNLISQLPQNTLCNTKEMFDLIVELSNSESTKIRSIIPKAMFNLANTNDNISTETIIMILIQNAINDNVFVVRKAILDVLDNNLTTNANNRPNQCQVQEILANQEFLSYFQILLNDDSISVKNTAFQLLGKLSDYNPLLVASYTRSSIMDAFFIIRHNTSIREISNYVATMPNLIKASSNTIRAYSGGFIDICITLLTQDTPIFENFLEVDAYNTILIGVMDSLSLLAPLDPDKVAHYGNSFIPFICNILLTNENRLLSLSIMNLFFTLFSAPASTKSYSYREKAPLIFSSCSKFLAKTHSRKARIATLKALGAIGVLEVHKRTPPPVCESPENIDDNLARQFFHPSRDSETNELNDSLLLKGKNSTSQYYSSIVASSLLELFKNDSMKQYYEEIVSALVQILKTPRVFMLGYFDSFVSRLLELMENSNNKEEIKMLTIHYSQLINNSTHNTSPFLKRSLDIIHKLFCSELASHLLDVILAFVNVMKDGFTPYASETICLLLSCLDDFKISDEIASVKVLSALETLGLYSNELIYLIVPSICNAIMCHQTHKKVRVSGLDSLSFLSKKVDIYPHLSIIIRAINFCIYFNDFKTRSASYGLIYSLLRAQGINFVNCGAPLFKSIQKYGMETPLLTKLIEEAKHEKSFHKFKAINDKQENQIRKRKSDFSLSLLTSEHPFSEDAIILRVQSSYVSVGRHMEQWMRSLVLATISNSPSNQIRACSSIATSYYPLAIKLFNCAFLSCWDEISEQGKQTIIESFRQLMLSEENYESIIRELYSLFVFMDKVGRPLQIPEDELFQVCMKYGGSAFALYLQEKLFYKTPDNVTIIYRLIEILMKTGDWHNALGVWKKYQLKETSLNKPNVLSNLKMWDQALPIYTEQFVNSHDFEAFKGMSQSLANMAMWHQLLTNYNYFEQLRSHQKREVSIFFAEAALHSGRWDILEEALNYAPDGSTRVCALRALNSIHKRNIKAVDDNIFNGFSLLASRPIAFWTDNQKIHPQTMRIAQEFIEISEMKKWVVEKADKTAIDNVWNARLITAPRDFSTWFHLIANRAKVISNINDDLLLEFFLIKNSNAGSKLHINAFDLIFPDFNYETAPEIQKICYIIAHWNAGEKEKAIQEMEILTQSFSNNKNVSLNLQIKSHSLCASWILEEGDDSLNVLKKAYNHLNIVVQNKFQSYHSNECIVNSASIPTIVILDDDTSNDTQNNNNSKPNHERYQKLTVDLNSLSIQERIQEFEHHNNSLIFPSQIMKELKTDQSNIAVLRMWSDVNYSLISLCNGNENIYIENALDALIKSAKLSPNFPDIVQLLNIFFDHGNNEQIFKIASEFISQLPPNVLIQASPQILIQLSHFSENVSVFVQNIVLSLLHEHYHSLIFPVIVMKKSANKIRSVASRSILKMFQKDHTDIYYEVELIRKALLRAAVTWGEKIFQIVSDALENIYNEQYDRMKICLKKILNIIKKPRCEMHKQFLKQYDRMITALDHNFKIFDPINNPNSVTQMTQWCRKMREDIGGEIKRIKLIQLSSISSELCSKTGFNIAVPGTYKPNAKINHIRYFVGQFSVFQSKQQPKDVIVKGEDGNFYQYLLKGHEDLRLDERIMQFFRLINSIAVKSSVYPIFHQNKINTTSVIPLSLQHGLVQWVPGTETLRAIIEQQRELHNRDLLDEFSIADYYCEASYDYLLPAQKHFILKKIFDETPDTDIADFFWLKAPTAEAWLKMTNNFAITCGMTSIVGYVIGLGDRHPSNLLIDRFSGKVIHIDFGDCFERAARRSLLPEVVPFRLTRMMVRTMGPAGTDGYFRASFVNMSQLLRDNKRILVMVLSTFVHEPLVDPDVIDEDDYYYSSKGRIAGSSPKLTITDLENGKSFHPGEVEGIQSSVEMRKTVIKKLTGADIDQDRKLTIEEQADILIRTATDTYMLAKMYSGWAPFW